MEELTMAKFAGNKSRCPLSHSLLPNPTTVWILLVCSNSHSKVFPLALLFTAVISVMSSNRLVGMSQLLGKGVIESHCGKLNPLLLHFLYAPHHFSEQSVQGNLECPVRSITVINHLNFLVTLLPCNNICRLLSR